MNFEYLRVDTSCVTTAIQDTIQVTTLTLTATSNIAESGGDQTYTVTYDNPTKSIAKVHSSYDGSGNSEATVQLWRCPVNGGETVQTITRTIADRNDVYVEYTSVYASLNLNDGENVESANMVFGTPVTTMDDTNSPAIVRRAVDESTMEETGYALTYIASITGSSSNPVLDTGSDFLVDVVWYDTS